jgi:fructose-1-phosphate kinase PfkB-like protein
MNWDYVRGKKKTKRKIKINKQKGNNQTKINKKNFKNNLYDSLVLYLTKKWLNP